VENQQHRITLHTNADQHGSSCSCGWVGQWFGTSDEASNDGDDHVIAMTRSE
jgi:hypothetical protein